MTGRGPLELLTAIRVRAGSLVLPNCASTTALRSRRAAAPTP